MHKLDVLVNPFLPQSSTVSIPTYFLIFSSATENNTKRGTKLWFWVAAGKNAITVLTSVVN